jgi:hypothetical protein
MANREKPIQLRMTASSMRVAATIGGCTKCQFILDLKQARR